MTQVSESCQSSALEFSQNIGLFAVVGQFPGELSGREVKSSACGMSDDRFLQGFAWGFGDADGVSNPMRRLLAGSGAMSSRIASTRS